MKNAEITVILCKAGTVIKGKYIFVIFI